MERLSYPLVFAMVFTFLVGGTLPVSAGSQFILVDAYDIALENNERLEVVRQQLNVAQQEVRVAFSQLLPEVSVSGESYRQKEIQQFGRTSPTEETIVSAKFRQPIYRGGKNITALTIRELQEKISRLKLFRRTQVVLFDVARLYFEELLSQKNIGIRENALERAQAQLKRAQKRRDVGKATRSSVLRAEVEISDALEQLEQARNNFQLAREDLLVELGVQSIPDTVQSVHFNALTDTPIETYRNRSYDYRLDLHRKALEVDAARARVDLERGDYYPNLNLLGSYNRFEDEMYHGSESDWRISVRASYPLFTGWKDDAQLKRSQHKKRSIKQEYDRLQREVRRDVRRAYLDLQSQRTVIETLENRRQSARENYQQTSAQFEEGLASSVDVSDALTVLNEAELRLAAARNTLMLDRLRLKLASGTFLTDFLTERTRIEPEPTISTEEDNRK